MHTPEQSTSLLFHMSDRANQAMVSFDNHWLFWAKTGLDNANAKRTTFQAEIKKNPPKSRPRLSEAERKKQDDKWRRVMATKTYQRNRLLRRLKYETKQLAEENAKLRRRVKAIDQGCLDLYDEIDQLIADLYSASIRLAGATEEADLIKARDDGTEIRGKLKELLLKLPVTP